jgi:hypothetical protein
LGIATIMQRLTMQRLTARLMLLFALAGTVVPLALAATAAPPHACCVRKTHHCHDSASPENTLVVSATSCCSHDCCRAATTPQWADATLRTTSLSVEVADLRVADSQPHTPVIAIYSSKSPRAPPQPSLA